MRVLRYASDHAVFSVATIKKDGKNEAKKNANIVVFTTIGTYRHQKMKVFEAYV
jgi:hypothetical protein